MAWTEEQLQTLPRSGGFRLRGAEMTRLETFVDAAFAFAMTIVVIAVNRVPGTYAELLLALKGAPAFAASFALLMLFWSGHRNWSRRYGLEDGPSIVLTLGLIFVMLVYVYPLKLMFSAFFSWISGGYLPSEFSVRSGGEMTGLFVVYGIGFGTLSGVLAWLHRRVLAVADALGLDGWERVRTQQQVAFWAVQAVTGLASAAFAGLMPTRLGVWAGFVYCTLPITMSFVANRYGKLAESVKADEVAR